MTAATHTADLLLHPGWIVPAVPEGVVLEGYSLALKNGDISALLPRAETATIEATEELELPGHALLPAW